MNPDRKSALIIGIGVPVMVSVFIIAVTLGRFQISFDAMIGILSGHRSEYEMEWNILTKLRIPRTMAALTVGIGLSVSGLLYQELFQNKLVSPDLLGASSGAGVGAAIGILLGMSAAWIGGLAFIGGILAVTLAVALTKSFRNRSSLMLLLSGIIIGGLMESILSFVKYIAGPEATLASITFWLMGSCEFVNMNEAVLLTVVVLVCTIIVWAVKWRLNLISLGEEGCRSRGINYKSYRRAIIVLATMMTACTVAVVGCVGWIGLVIPHISRLWVGQNTKYTIPMTVVLGGTFMVAVDLISRLFTTSEIPLSAVTGLFGAVIIILVIIRNGGKIDDRI